MSYRSTSLLLLLLCGSYLFAQPLPEIDYDGGARSHPFDLLHTTLDIHLDFEEERVRGIVTHHMRSLNSSLTRVELDAAPEIDIAEIIVDGVTTPFEHKGDNLTIDLIERQAYNDTFNLHITYQASPKKGLYFVKKEPEETNGRDQIWTQGEGEDHHYWIPMYDYPNDLATSEVLCRSSIRLEAPLKRQSSFQSSAERRWDNYVALQDGETLMLPI